MLRKKPTGVPETKIPLKNPETYAKLWFDNQEDLDAYDSLMRKKVYYQNAHGEKLDKDFVLNGYKTTFGIFSKEFQERRYKMSDKLKEQVLYVESVVKDPKNFDKFFSRYHSQTDYHNPEYNRRFFQILFAALVIRELPLKHFYARAFVVGFFTTYMVFKTWKYNNNQALPSYYHNWRESNDFANYPMLYSLVMTRINNKIRSPSVLESDHWYQNQMPVFYQHHFKHYRYVFRNRRVVPWDGTMNQPVFPFMCCNNRSGFVSNGTLEATEPKAGFNF
jgi:hypothetical protein